MKFIFLAKKKKVSRAAPNLASIRNLCAAELWLKCTYVVFFGAFVFPFFLRWGVKGQINDLTDIHALINRFTWVMGSAKNMHFSSQ